MLTQHLTVAQTKYLFIGKDCMAYRCSDGMNPQDLERYELRPLVVATLSVEGLGIYWQRLYFGDEPIPLESFLYLAWTEFHTLGGMPGHLIQGHSWNQSLLLLGMVESMLATIAAWREADRPADHR
ncbi:hypothetical protein HMPREF1224_11768 [Pseudomonas sp. P179]|uniref:hypothetical protein n=1 Tax=Pseudomonas TaxID=286 RepID=UPI0002CA5599|nr:MULTISPECIES: hypothetical protein [Pseudomonas]EMZ44511.1 hypothetical protein HMPREF1224_11768 [Pseudomonas sp. P179]